MATRFSIRMKPYIILLVFGAAVIVGFAVFRKIIWRALAGWYRYAPLSVPGVAACPECNVLFISLDVLRADALPCYGYGRETAPNICAFAKRNAYFTNFYSVSSYTMDDHISMMTGLYPSSHGMLVPFKDSLNPKIPNMAEVLKSAGYRTVFMGVTDDPNLPIDKGVGRGFAEVRAMERTDRGLKKSISDIQTLMAGGKPTFVFLHSYAMHAPYLAGPGPRMFTPGIPYPSIPLTMQEFQPDTMEFYAFARDDLLSRVASSTTPVSIGRNTENYQKLADAVSTGDVSAARRVFRDRLFWIEQWTLYNEWYWHHIGPYVNADLTAYLRGLYDERLVQLDGMLSPLLDFASRPDIRRKTIVIISSDHGEEFNEHGFFEHDNNLYNTTTYVPFIIASPRIRGGAYNNLGETVDIYPTVLELLGIRKVKPTDGKSLVPILSGKPGADTVAISQYRGGLVTSVQDGRWKLYIHAPYAGQPLWRELYDLLLDPGENRNVLAAYPSEADRLAEALRQRLSRSPKYAPVEVGFPEWMDTKKQQKLIEKGYF